MDAKKPAEKIRLPDSSTIPSNTLIGQPKDVRVLVRNLLSPADKRSLAMTCRLFYHQHFNELANHNNDIHGYRHQTILALLHAVLKNNPSHVRYILDLDSNLLYKKDLVTDDAEHQIIGTALQCALGSQNTDMCKLILSYLYKLPNGASEALQQWNEQFPDTKNKKHTSPFKQIVKAISKYPACPVLLQQTELEAALAQFRKIITPNTVIKSGYHFQVETLIDAFKIYKNKSEEWTPQQRFFFAVKVIGYLLRYAPIWLAQTIILDPAEKLDNPLLHRITLPVGKSLYSPDISSLTSKQEFGIDYMIIRGLPSKPKYMSTFNNLVSQTYEILLTTYKKQTAELAMLKSGLIKKKQALDTIEKHEKKYEPTQHMEDNHERHKHCLVM